MEVGGVISQCAESIVLEASFYGQRAIVKHRVKKAYRHADLDIKIREQRTVREARALVRSRKLGVPTPDVYNVDKKQCTIAMERIMGITAREYIQAAPPESQLPGMILRRMGHVIGLLHAGDIIHGDLTTSNFMLRDADDTNSIVVIDFGLVRQSTDAEERAVDLYVLERAISSTHPLLVKPMEHVWAGYAGCGMTPAKLDQTAKRLELVRARGRKRSMIG